MSHHSRLRLVGILSVPAKALDGAQTPSPPNVGTSAQAFNGTPSPPYVMPPLKAEPLPPGLLAQAPSGTAGVDPLIGTWKLNREKSTLVGGFQMQKSLIFTVIKDGDHMVSNVEGVTGQGQAFKFVVQHIYDGIPHPITGTTAFDTAALTRIGNTYNQVRFKNGIPVEVMQMVIAGKIATGTSEGIANGQPYHEVYVYDKQ